MKVKLLFILIPGLAGLSLLFASYSENEGLYSNGAPSGYTNSPHDGRNCSHCMGGSASPVTGWITSDVPSMGYKNDSTYHITVTATGSGNKGFEVSPQDPAGNILGTLIAGSGSKLIDTGKYITHTAPKTGSSASWVFQWTAPSSGNGDITFYGSIAVTKLVTKTTTLTITKNTVGIDEMNIAGFSVFPNPVHSDLNIDLNLLKGSTVRMELLDMNSRVLNVFTEEFLPSGQVHKQVRLNRPAGLYVLTVKADNQMLSKKIIVE